MTAGSPAERAELKFDDVIVAFNEIPVEDDNHLVNLVGLTPIGVEVPLTVIRDGQAASLRVTLTRRNGQADNY